MIDALHDAIADLLTTEPTFVADVQALALGSSGAAATPGVLRSFRPLRSLGQEHYPSWLLEPGDATSIEESIGSHCQTFEVEILLALVWHQQDHATAYAQRLALLSAITRLFLRNPRPGDIADVRVDAEANDRSANHPAHIATLRLLATVRIER